MAATEDPLISTNEKEFILKSFRQYYRLDGRFLLEYRRIGISVDRSEGKALAEVTLGSTRVLAVVTASVTAPFPDRPAEGFLAFNVNTSPMSGPSYDAPRQTAQTSELSRMLERQIRDSRAIDTEGLCITPGSQVWALRCDAHVLDDCGNLIDACALATIAAILHFRRAEVSTQDGKTIIHSYAERAPVPLAIHHIPICVTFGLYHAPKLAGPGSGARAPKRSATEAMAVDQGGIGSMIDDVVESGDDVVILDPNDRELLVSHGTLSFVMNAHKELCGIHKLGGCPINSSALMQCAKVAGLRAVEVIEQLKAALGAAEAADVEKHRGRLAVAAGVAEKAGIDLLEPDQAMHHEEARALIANSIASVISTEIEQMASNRAHKTQASGLLGAVEGTVVEMDFLKPT